MICISQCPGRYRRAVFSRRVRGTGAAQARLYRELRELTRCASDATPMPAAAPLTLLVVAASTSASSSGPALAQRWTLVNKTEGAVLGPHLAGEHGIRSGFEGGQYFRTEDGVYHYFATEMVNDGSEMWVGTRGGHWTATDPSVPDVAAKKAGCTTTRQPCPGHQGRSYCPSDKKSGQCDRPPTGPCPPCPPAPPTPQPTKKHGGWQRQGTLFNSSGIFNGSDRAGAKWAPMVNYGWSPENKSDVYTLWYVGYRTGALPNSSTPSGHWANWDGQVRRMVSTVAGNSSAALAGPYVDMGVVFDTEQPDVAPFEGLQGDDSVNCYQLQNGSWIMFVGTTLDACPDKSSPRQGCKQGFQRNGRTVAFASSPTLGGPWKRLGVQQTTIQPLPTGTGSKKSGVEPNMENPVVTKSPWQMGYHAVYADLLNGSIGITFSASGEPSNWTVGQHLPIRGRTGLGLVPEPTVCRGCYSIMYTASRVYYAMVRNENEAKGMLGA
jgi:hypothetical protein